MTLDHAQRDMRNAYLCGAPGMLASALAWLAAGLVAWKISPAASVWTLFGAGMLIHPVGVLISKAAGRRGQHAKGNPLGALALESTGWLILMLPLAWAVSRLEPRWFFPAMLLVIGGRYLVFQTLYGLRLYWACAAALALAAYGVAALGVPVAAAALLGAGIEACFAALLWRGAVLEAARPLPA